MKASAGRLRSPLSKTRLTSWLVTCSYHVLAFPTLVVSRESTEMNWPRSGTTSASEETSLLVTSSVSSKLWVIPSKSPSGTWINYLQTQCLSKTVFCRQRPKDGASVLILKNKQTSGWRTCLRMKTCARLLLPQITGSDLLLTVSITENLSW